MLGLAQRGDVGQTVLAPPQIVNQWYYLFSGQPLTVGGTGSIDLNGDGTPDLTFVNRANTSVGTLHGFWTSVQPASGVHIVRNNFPPYFSYFQATALGAGSTIGPSSSFSDVEIPLVDPTSGNPGVANPWPDKALHYLGFSLTNGLGETQYGWIAMKLGAVTPIDTQHRLDGYQNAGNGVEIDSFASNPILVRRWPPA